MASYWRGILEDSLRKSVILSLLYFKVFTAVSSINALLIYSNWLISSPESESSLSFKEAETPSSSSPSLRLSFSSLMLSKSSSSTIARFCTVIGSCGEACRPTPKTYANISYFILIISLLSASFFLRYDSYIFRIWLSTSIFIRKSSFLLTGFELEDDCSSVTSTIVSLLVTSSNNLPYSLSTMKVRSVLIEASRSASIGIEQLLDCIFPTLSIIGVYGIVRYSKILSSFVLSFFILFWIKDSSRSN